jgi:hypothetical protein
MKMNTISMRQRDHFNLIEIVQLEMTKRGSRFNLSFKVKTRSKGLLSKYKRKITPWHHGLKAQMRGNKIYYC